jgi:hypothetical protein
MGEQAIQGAGTADAYVGRLEVRVHTRATGAEMRADVGVVVQEPSRDRARASVLLRDELIRRVIGILR